MSNELLPRRGDVPEKPTHRCLSCGVEVPINWAVGKRVKTITQCSRGGTCLFSAIGVNPDVIASSPDSQQKSR